MCLTTTSCSHLFATVKGTRAQETTQCEDTECSIHYYNAGGHSTHTNRNKAINKC